MPTLFVVTSIVLVIYGTYKTINNVKLYRVCSFSRGEITGFVKKGDAEGSDIINPIVEFVYDNITYKFTSKIQKGVFKRYIIGEIVEVVFEPSSIVQTSKFNNKRMLFTSSLLSIVTGVLIWIMLAVYYYIVV